jgi:hypothetical protein
MREVQVTKQSKQWDVFICHASEDKDAFVRPLAVALRRLGVSVWYDEFSLRLGDSLSRIIDRGLAGSRYGLVVISRQFIGKPWPERELSGLVAREIGEDRVILPVWHGVTRDEVLAFSPPLADKRALLTADLPAQDMAIMLLREIRPDLYEKHPRAELERRASGEAIRDLQEALEAAYEELSEYRCPYCNAPLAERVSVMHEYGDDLVERFVCGCQIPGPGGVGRVPCPSDPEFPAFDDYDLHFEQEHEVDAMDDKNGSSAIRQQLRLQQKRRQEEHGREWYCYAFGKTEMARAVHLQSGIGQTREEAERMVRESYERISKPWS